MQTAERTGSFTDRLRDEQGVALVIALLCMLCAAQATWVIAGGSDAGTVIAAAEGIYAAP